MGEADTPMTTQREVRERKRGLYWLIAALVLLVLCFAVFGLAYDFAEEGAATLGDDSSAVVSGEAEAVDVDGE